jgi:SAM-dependent methyltransferase
MVNPHFDQNRVVWKDEYSGLYQPPVYHEQFEKQWRLALENMEYGETPGSSVSEAYIADRVYEWTGVRPGGGGFHDPGMGSRVLDERVDPDLIRGKKCLDLCCGMGRWTKVMQSIGAAEVLSTDLSASALASVSRFNPNTREVDLMTLPEQHPDLVGAFDFTNCWGVVHHTHDPLKAFQVAAGTVAPGGALYLMVYAPSGIHAQPLTNRQRKIFHAIDNVEERLAFVERVWRREWDWRYPLIDNLKNRAHNFLGRDKGYLLGVMDMLSPQYNWVIPRDTVFGWMRSAGFQEVIHLNHGQQNPCAHHVLGRNKTD